MTDRTPTTPPTHPPTAHSQALVNGQADTAEALRLLKIIKDLSLRTWRDHLTVDDQTFMFDMSDKAHNQGTGLYVSQRQLWRLRELWAKLHRAGVL